MDIFDPNGEIEKEVDSLASDDIWSDDETKDDPLAQIKVEPGTSAQQGRKRTRSQALMDNFEILTGSRPDSILDPETGIVIPDYTIGTTTGPWRLNTVLSRLDTKSLSASQACFEKADRSNLEVRK